MNDSSWIPKRIFHVEEVLQTKSIGGLKVGTAKKEIDALLGPPELPLAKLNRKSKIWVSLYGNVSLLICDQKVICINIEFHGNRTETVQVGSLMNWQLPEWQKYAESYGWYLKPVCDVYKIEGDGFTISLEANGKIGMLSFQ